MGRWRVSGGSGSGWRYWSLRRSNPAVAGAAVRHGTACVERHVVYVEGKIDVQYRPGAPGTTSRSSTRCPSLPHSARDLTWKFVLPTDGKFSVAGTGFGFWFGGTVTDPDPKALFNQGFLEVQFYPDTLVSECKQNGDSIYTYAKNTYTVCSPVWSIVGNSEPAAFNAMLRQDGGHRGPLAMHAATQSPCTTTARPPTTAPTSTSPI
jgi:hypothetical protein